MMLGCKVATVVEQLEHIIYSASLMATTHCFGFLLFCVGRMQKDLFISFSVILSKICTL